MKDYFSNIAPDEMTTLRESGVSEKDLSNALALLAPDKIRSPLTKIHVMFYIDKRGDFLSGNTKLAQIVKALYNSLDKPDQQACMMYLMDKGN